MNKEVKKTCIWCGNTFYGYVNRVFCDLTCQRNYRMLQLELKRNGKEYARDYVLSCHRDRLIEERKRKLTHKVLRPVHLTSRSVQWRYVDER